MKLQPSYSLVASSFLGLALVALAGPAAAQNAINLDIQGTGNGGPGFNLNVGTYNGQGVPVTGTSWNGRQYAAGYSGLMNDDQGTGTAINAWFANNLNEWSYNVGVAGLDVNAEALMSDYAFISSAGNFAFTFFTSLTGAGGSGSGLALSPGSVWDVYVYAAGDAAGQGANITLSDFSGSSTLSTTGDGPWNGTFTAGANYVKFSNVSPRAYTAGADNGYEFAFSWSRVGSSAGINGIQLVQTQVPEPSSMAFALLGGLAILARKISAGKPEANRVQPSPTTK